MLVKGEHLTKVIKAESAFRQNDFSLSATASNLVFFVGQLLPKSVSNKRKSSRDVILSSNVCVSFTNNVICLSQENVIKSSNNLFGFTREAFNYNHDSAGSDF